MPDDKDAPESVSVNIMVDAPAVHECAPVEIEPEKE